VEQDLPPKFVKRGAQMSDSLDSSMDESKPKTTVSIIDWAGNVQLRLILHPPEIKYNHTLNIVIGPDGTIAREEDMEIL
jgi:hypothetical protein